MTSDARDKSDVRPLDPAVAARLVRAVPTYTYTIDGQVASGVLAEDIPPEYTQTGLDGRRQVDYNALLANLWAAVQHLQGQVDEIQRREIPATRDEN